MLDIIKIALALHVTDLEADSLRKTAPQYLTLDAARENIAYARVALVFVELWPNADADLLSIAWHESRYTANVKTFEPGGGVSCGVMTPKPIARCSPSMLELGGGYLHGADHLREWAVICQGALEGVRVCAMRGYSGNALDGQVRGPGGTAIPTWQVFDARAQWIRGAWRRP